MPRPPLPRRIPALSRNGWPRRPVTRRRLNPLLLLTRPFVSLALVDKPVVYKPIVHRTAQSWNREPVFFSLLVRRLRAVENRRQLVHSRLDLARNGFEGKMLIVLEIRSIMGCRKNLYKIWYNIGIVIEFREWVVGENIMLSISRFYEEISYNVVLYINKYSILNFRREIYKPLIKNIKIESRTPFFFRLLLYFPRLKIKIQLCADYLFTETETVHLPLPFSNWLDPIVIMDRLRIDAREKNFRTMILANDSSLSHERVLRKLGRERERERRKAQANLPITGRSWDPYARSMIGRVIYGLDVLRKSISLSLFWRRIKRREGRG